MILVIFELVPEAPRLFLIPSDHAMSDYARKSDGKYINAYTMGDDDPIYALNDFIYTNEGQSMEITTPYEGEKGSITEIVKCGYIL